MRTHWDFINRGGEALWRQIKTSTPILLVLVMLFLLVGIWWLAPRLTWHGHPLPIDLSMQVALTVILLLIPTLLWALLLRGRYNKLDAERKHEAVVKDDLCLPFVRAQEQSLDHSLTMLRQNMASRNCRGIWC
jgi:type VI secretion system protein ImpL